MSRLLLNVGSGQRPFAKPWVNVDIQARWKPDVVADGSSMPMFEDGSADVIVLHHVLEHFGCGEGAAMIWESYRILAPSGSLIVTVPDMRELVKGWITCKIDTQIFLTNVYGAYMNDEADRHKWGFTKDTLARFLWTAAPWGEVIPYSYPPLHGADIAKDWWILGVEAIK